MNNPGDSTDKVLNNLTFKFQISNEEEIIILFDFIKKSKQYAYDNIHLLDNYVNKLEDLIDNKKTKFHFYTLILMKII